MTLQLLQEKIQEAGAANALIYLDTKHHIQPAINQRVSRGRFSRQAPVFNPQVLEDLSNRFSIGWSSLPTTSDLSDLETTIPAIKDLVSGINIQQQKSHMLHFPHLGVVYGALNQQALESLVDHEAVNEIHHVNPEWEIVGATNVNNIVAKQQGEVAWGLQRIGALELWQQNLSGTDILVAHLDTGMDSKHPALIDSLKEAMASDKSGTKITPPNPLVDADTSTVHGTHTASVIAARRLGEGPIVGMAPAAELACGIVAPNGHLPARFLCGMEWALNTGARVINMSIGVSGIDNSFAGVINSLREKQMLPIAAAGNYGPQVNCSPGCYTTVLSVGAVDRENQTLVYSGKATNPAVSAPGIEICAAASGGQYSEIEGTSIAAPHVTGLAALLFDAKPNATIDQVQEAIIASCDNPNQIASDCIGAGIPNGMAALKHLNKIVDFE